MTISPMPGTGTSPEVISQQEEKFNDSLGPYPWDAFVEIDPSKLGFFDRLRQGRGWGRIDYLLEEEKKHREIIQNRLEHQRQDNSYQRKAADLALAGLSQTLSPGGSGSPTSQANRPSAPSIGDKRIANMTQKIAMMQGVANVAKTAAETASTAGALGGVRAATEIAKIALQVKQETKQWEIDKIEREAAIAYNTVRKVFNEAEAKEYDALVSSIKASILKGEEFLGKTGYGNVAREGYVLDMAIAKEAQAMKDLGMGNAEILKKMQQKDWVSTWEPGNLMKNAAGIEPMMGMILNIAETLGLNVGAVKKALGY